MASATVVGDNTQQRPGLRGTPARATEICNYDELKLKAPSGFKDYTWNNNANTAAITIKKPGLYWVEVIDQNNCKGKDSIAVNLKECITGFFIPTAFTPNNDGKNDVFKPLIFGNVKSYQFTIYNRWGEVVFKSKDIKKGWDGNFKSLSQSTNVFIWLCTYQLEGELKQTKKGTAVLIR
jgi:gliding motility-associated-like protein